MPAVPPTAMPNIKPSPNGCFESLLIACVLILHGLASESQAAAPTISNVTDKTTLESTATTAIAFTVGDTETAAATLMVTATSSDETLLPPDGIVLGGSESSRTVTLTPATGLSGTTMVTLTVTDEELLTATDTFVLAVTPVYTLPAEAIPDVVMEADGSFTIHFQMGNGSWMPSATRTNADLFNSVGTASSNDIRFQGTGTNRTLRLRPTAGRYGSSGVSLTIAGGAGGPTTTTFQVTVVPRAVADHVLGISGKTSTFDILRNDTLPAAGTEVVLQSFTQPAHGTVVAGTVPGTVRYTPAAGHTGADSFGYTTTYNTGAGTPGAVHVTVGDYYAVDAVHLDLRTTFANGVWTHQAHADLPFGTPNVGGVSNPTILDYDEFLMMANPTSIITLPTTVDPAAYSFTGVAPGGQVWALPATHKAGVLWPGVSTESVPVGTFAAYTPTGDWRATANAVWLRLELVDYRIPAGSAVSMWDSGGLGGQPRVHFDTIDGINGPNETAHGNNPSDTFWITRATHSHMNWWFTHPGRYELDVRWRAYVDQGGTLVEVASPVNTLHFMVYGTDDPSTTGPMTEAPPQAANDAVTITRGGGASVLDVLANDSSSPDPLEVLTITSITQPTHGSVSIAGNGATVSYLPNASFIGSETFTYTVTDEHGGSRLATVEVTVVEGNGMPSFTPGDSLRHAPGTTGTQVLNSWATNMDDGDPEVVQSLSFAVSVVSGAGLFSVPPAIDPLGNLTYSLTGAEGMAVLSVALTDDNTAGGPALTTPATQFKIIVAPALAAWRYLNFDRGDNDGDAANGADPDHDGVPNLLEYAFDLLPKTNSTTGLPVAVRNGSYLEYRFIPPADATGVVYEAEWSPSLLPGNWLPLNDEGEAPERVFRLNASGTGPAFMRLKIREP